MAIRGLKAALVTRKGHRPVRTCIVCRKRYFKDQLMRLALKYNKIVVDEDKSMPGRGAYVCGRCLELAKRNYRGCLNRAFKTRKVTIVMGE